jgi:hypothetical protein
VLIYINLIILWFCKIFLNNYRQNYIRYFSEGNTDGMKRINFFYTHFLSVIKFIGNNIFFITNGLTNRKKQLPMKDSSTEYFRQ